MSRLADTASRTELITYLAELTDRVVHVALTSGAHMTGILTDVASNAHGTAITLLTGHGALVSIHTDGLESIDPADAGMPPLLNGYPVIAFLPRMRPGRIHGAPQPQAVPGEWVAVCRRTEPEVAARPYCTWRVLRHPGRAGVTCTAGAYDMTLREALADLATRADDAGLDGTE